MPQAFMVPYQQLTDWLTPAGDLPVLEVPYIGLPLKFKKKPLWYFYCAFPMFRNARTNTVMLQLLTVFSTVPHM